MSELIHTRPDCETARWKLLVTVSAAALLAASSSEAYAASDTDRPTVWIELGGQLEGLGGSKEVYAPPFVVKNLDMPYNVVSPLSQQGTPRFAVGGEGKISIQPQGSDWVFSAGVRFGRSSNARHLHQEDLTPEYKIKAFNYNKYHQFAYVRYIRLSDVVVQNQEHHAILDFTVGKDVGLGSRGTSTISAGIRIAQFRTESNIGFKSLPDPKPATAIPDTNSHHHSYSAAGNFVHSFNGVGPSISWEGSAPVLGEDTGGQLGFDWGINAAVLFGRQKVQGQHQTTGRYWIAWEVPHSSYQHVAPLDRSRTRTVPNAGGFAALSFRFPRAAVRVGYRADLFFNAIDGGIDSSKTYDRGFYGPFATISIGLGG